MPKPFVPVVLGTARIGRNSEKIARYFFELLQADGRFETELLDVKDYIFGRTIPPWENSEETKPWRSIVAKASGFLFVVPEYNHGYPGEFKMLVDQEYRAYTGKKAALCCVSDGIFGGSRMRENALPVLHQVGLQVLVDTLYVMKAPETFAASKEELDVQYKERAKKIFDQLV